MIGLGETVCHLAATLRQCPEFHLVTRLTALLHTSDGVLQHQPNMLCVAGLAGHLNWSCSFKTWPDGAGAPARGPAAPRPMPSADEPEQAACASCQRSGGPSTTGRKVPEPPSAALSRPATGAGTPRETAPLAACVAAAAGHGMRDSRDLTRMLPMSALTCLGDTTSERS